MQFIDLSDFFQWVRPSGYIIHCRHLISISDLSSAVNLPTPAIPTQCWDAEDGILWAELSLVRGVALAEAALDNQTFVKACWCYRSNIKLHKACVTNRKRSRDVLADSSPEPSHPPVVKMPQQWTEEEHSDDIIFRSDHSTSYPESFGSKTITKAKCKGGRGKKSSKKSSKCKSIGQAPAQLSPPGICSDELWPAVEMFLSCYQLCHPVCYSVLLRDVCLWMATCIGHHNDQLTAYFLHHSHGNMLHHKMIEQYRKNNQ